MDRIKNQLAVIHDGCKEIRSLLIQSLQRTGLQYLWSSYPYKQLEVIAKIENCVQSGATLKLSIKKNGAEGGT